LIRFISDKADLNYIIGVGFYSHLSNKAKRLEAATKFEINHPGMEFTSDEKWDIVKIVHSSKT